MCFYKANILKSTHRCNIGVLGMFLIISGFCYQILVTNIPYKNAAIITTAALRNKNITN